MRTRVGAASTGEAAATSGKAIRPAPNVRLLIIVFLLFEGGRRPPHLILYEFILDRKLTRKHILRWQGPPRGSPASREWSVRYRCRAIRRASDHGHRDRCSHRW